MKRFLLKIFIFAAVVAVCDFVLGSVLCYMNLNSRVGDNGRNNYINREMTADAVVLGSSEAVHHYVPWMIEDSLGFTCYNAGTEGQGIICNYAHYQLFSKRYHPKLIIYDLSPAVDLLESDNTRYLKWLKTYCYDDSVKQIVKEISRAESVKMLSHLYRVNNNFIETVRDYIYPAVMGVNGDDTNHGYTALSRIMEYPGEEDDDFHDEYKYDSLKLSFMEKFVEACKEDGVMLVFFISPLFNASDDGVFQPVRDLAAQYGIMIKDHYCDERISKNMELFSDKHHMNASGAKAYTDEVISDLKGILYF